jgi:hypothetical protein
MKDDDQEVARKLLRRRYTTLFWGEGHDLLDRVRIIDRSEFVVFGGDCDSDDDHTYALRKRRDRNVHTSFFLKD